jgi:GT2 family glycosyltransferase
MVIERLGLFDPRYFLYYEEVDHCRSVKNAGWKVFYFAATEVIHLGGESAASTGPIVNATRQISALQTESELLYFRKHHGWLGVAMATFLTVSAEAMKALKALLTGAGRTEPTEAMPRVFAFLRVVRDTSFGSRSTR